MSFKNNTIIGGVESIFAKYKSLFQPKQIFPFLNWWPEVGRETLRADFLAGLTGAIIVIPQGVAFAIIAGLPPIYGLFTAMVIPIVAALFGSSRHLISGPTTPISILIFSSASQFALSGTPEFLTIALTLTFLAGVFQSGLGIARLGNLVNFVSHVVVIGFTAGAALLIIASQIKHIFGTNIPGGATFLETIGALFHDFEKINPFTILITAVTLAAAIIFKKYFPKSPYLLPAMVLGSVLAYFLGGENVGIHLVGEMPASLPMLSSPDFSFGRMRQLTPNAFAIALLGLIEAVAIARSIAIKSQQQIDANQEFVGQGLSNVVGSFFSCYAGSGSFTRSGLNYETGARTPMSAIFAAVILMILVLLIAPLTAYLPMAAMAGIILFVAYNLVNFHQIRQVIKASKRQTSVLVITFFTALLLDLEFAIFFGVLFSLFFYLRKTSQPNIVVMAPDPSAENRHFQPVKGTPIRQCPQLKIIRIDGSLFFGAINHISTEIRQLTGGGEKHLLIVATGINFIDVGGSEWLTNEARRFREMGGGLYLVGLKHAAQDTLIRGGFKKEIGDENFFFSKEEAIEEIYRKLDKTICATCTARIFRECAAA